MPRGGASAAAGAAALAVALAAAAPALAQSAAAPQAGGAGASPIQVPSPILTIDQDRLFADSAWGRRVLAEIERRSAALAAENRRIEAALVAEERALTDRRGKLPPEQFRQQAAAFDEKVQRLRNEQDGKTRAIAQMRDSERQAFFGHIEGVLSNVVRQRGAVAILDRRAVFLSADAIDVTDESIAGIDAALGDGAGLAADPSAPAAAPPAAPDTAEDPPAEQDVPALELPAAPDRGGAGAPSDR
ncbi:MAG: OmpH family outer membrane protein [Tranquillimonas sp.]